MLKSSTSESAMACPEIDHRKAISLSAVMAVAVALLIYIAPSQKSFAATGSPSNENISQPVPPQEKKEDPKAEDLASQESVATFAKNLDQYSTDKIAKLRSTNQAFSTSFIVAGITLTLLSTVLGTVESQDKNVKTWTKYAIAGLGAGAIAAQSLNSAFPVTKRAGAYAVIDSKITILKFKTQDIKTKGELKQAKDEFYGLILQAGNAEGADEQPKKN